MASPETKIFQVPLEEFTAARNARAKPTTLSAIWPVGGLR